MRIAIDASRAATTRRTGTENYSLQLTRAMLAQHKGTHASDRRFTLYFNHPPEPGLFPAAPNVEQRVIPFRRLWTHLRLAAALMGDRPDVLFVPAHVLPLTYRGPSVVTIHDLGYVYYPDAHPLRSRLYLRWATQHNVRMATHLLADSEATKRDLMEHFGLSDERITVTPLGLDPGLAPVTEDAALADVRARYGIPHNYLLHVGTVHPRKNLARLVAAHARLWEQRRTRAVLVLAGGTGWLPDSIQKAVRESPAPVILTGYVPDSDRAALYSGAIAVVAPSLYEGFGLPALEAMACGTPVVAANASSLPEVVGNTGELVDPLSVEDIARGIDRVASSPALRRDLSGRGLERAKLFTWERTAALTLEVLDRVARAGNPAGNRQTAHG